MELTPYVDAMRRDLSAATALADEPTRNVVERLGATLDTSARLAMFDALSTACAEISREMSPGAVEVRLAGRDPQFVVTNPPRMGPPAPPVPPHPPHPGHPPAPTAPMAPLAPAAPTSALPAGTGDETLAQPMQPGGDDTTDSSAAVDGQADADEAEEETDDDLSLDVDGGSSRITLRLPTALKARVDEAANNAGVSVNTWLVEAVARQLREQRNRDRGQRARNRERSRHRRHGRGFDFDLDLPDFGQIGQDVARDVSRAMRDASRDVTRSMKRVPGTHVTGWVR